MRLNCSTACANRNAVELAKLARELDVRFAAIADPAAYRELKDALAGSGIEARRTSTLLMVMPP